VKYLVSGRGRPKPLTKALLTDTRLKSAFVLSEALHIDIDEIMQWPHAKFVMWTMYFRDKQVNEELEMKRRGKR
jgi:hypothetical protein